MTDRMQRFLFWFLAIALVVGTSLALRYAKGYQPLTGLGVNRNPLLQGEIALRFENVRVIGRQNNKKAWLLTAGRIETTRARDHVDFAGGIEATLLQNEKPRARFTAPTARYEASQKLLTAHGKVSCVVQGTGKSSQGDLRIDSENVSWNVGAKQVYCPGAVRATLPGATVTGDGLVVDLTTRDFTVNNFDADISLNENADPTESLKGILQ